MITEPFAVLIAILVPIVTLLALVGLIRGVTELERSREELIELRRSAPTHAPSGSGIRS